MTDQRGTAPDRQGRNALAYRIAIEHFQQRENILKETNYQDAWYHPFTENLRDDCNHVLEGEVVMAPRYPFGTGPAAGQTLIPSFTNLAALAVSRQDIKTMRESGEMLGSDRDIAYAIIYRDYCFLGLVGTNAQFSLTAGGYVGMFSGDIAGKQEFLNLTKMRINFSDQLEARLPEEDEMKRPELEGLDSRKILVVLAPVKPHDKRPDRMPVLRKLGLDSPKGLENPVRRQQKKMGGTVYYEGKSALGRDQYAEALANNSMLSAHNGMRVLLEFLRAQSPQAEAAVSSLMQGVDLEKLSGLVDLQGQDDLDFYTLKPAAVQRLGKGAAWQDVKPLAHRAALHMSIAGLDQNEVPARCVDRFSRSLQKSGAVELMVRGHEAHMKRAERSFGMCTRACNPLEKGDVVLSKALRI